jgi:hypothetical protein
VRGFGPMKCHAGLFNHTNGLEPADGYAVTSRPVA